MFRTNLIVSVCLVISLHVDAKMSDFAVETSSPLSPYTVQIEDTDDSFKAQLRVYRVDEKGQVGFGNQTFRFDRDALNPPLFWGEEVTILPKSTIAWGYRKDHKHKLVIAVIDEKGYLTVSFYEENSPKKFTLTLIQDPYFQTENSVETKIQLFEGDYVGQGAVTFIDEKAPTNTKRDIDFALKSYPRGFELVKSLIICPEGREQCTDGKRKNDKYYFKNVSSQFYVEETKGSLFEKAKPYSLRETGRLQYAIWHKGHLKTYTLNYTPLNPLILEFSSWRFTEGGGQYSYMKYVDAQLNKKVEGPFFKAKEDDQYKPQTPE